MGIYTVRMELDLDVDGVSFSAVVAMRWGIDEAGADFGGGAMVMAKQNQSIMPLEYVGVASDLISANY